MVFKEKGMSKIIDELRRAPHSFKPSLNNFQELDPKSIERELQLVNRAKSRGEENEPAVGSKTFDVVENEIVEYVDGVKSKNYQILLDGLEVYNDRISLLNLDSKQNELKLEVERSLAEYEGIIERGLDNLHAKRRRLLIRENDLKQFQDENKLIRSAIYPTFPKKVFLIGLIALLLLVETFGNTAFLAKGNELGILGAITEAVVISALNLIGAMLFAQWVKNSVHVKLRRQLIGYIGFAIYILYFITLNLAVAHYREVSGVLMESGGIEAINRMHSDPTGLTEFQSWMLLGMGCIFSIISFWDSLQLDDIYPGYGKRTRILDEDREYYIAEKEEHINQLEEHLDITMSKLTGLVSDMKGMKGELFSIVDSRSVLIESFKNILVGLERTGNSLLSIYREANRKARNGRAPRRFNENWNMEIPNISNKSSSISQLQQSIEKIIEEADLEVNIGLEELKKKHKEGIDKFRALDDLVRDESFEDLGNA